MSVVSHGFDFRPTRNLAELNGNNGLVSNGSDRGDLSGFSVGSAGDANGDGLFDLIMGSREADPGGKPQTGDSRVKFGGNFTLAVDQPDTAGDDSLSGTSAEDGVFGALGARPWTPARGGIASTVTASSSSTSTIPASATLLSISIQSQNKFEVSMGGTSGSPEGEAVSIFWHGLGEPATGLTTLVHDSKSALGALLRSGMGTERRFRRERGRCRRPQAKRQRETR
jgi:hypothetical protein